ncbi:MAG TPA: DNA polymerase III subunit beta [Blastocatellia bacterium]|nr:DNA polymerase III subunit beta [Blastocatellia bacterium]
MQFSVSKNVLLKELNLLQGIVEKKSTIPILSNVLIETANGSMISLVATDLDVSLQTECAAESGRSGSIVLQARKLFEIVRNLPDAEINFAKEDNDWVKVVCASSEFRIVGQAKEHFPSTPKAEKAGITIPAGVLHRLINRTVFAITQEESRYALNGALLSFSEGRLQMVATDGHRLALAAAGLDQALDGGAEPLKVIVPKKALIELAKLTAGMDEDLELSKDENHLYFQIQNRHLTSRMLAGQFPNYDLVLPKNNDKSITMNVDRITQAIRRAALMADERSHGVKVDLSNGKLSITSQSADVGEAKEVIPLDYAGDNLSIGFNAQYVLDFLGVVGTDEVVFEFKDEQSPALLRPSGDGQADYKYVVMPMRLL